MRGSFPSHREIRRILKPEGSFVLNVGGAWTPGAPLRSLYHYRLLLALCDDVGFNLCQEFFWHNPAKMPAPAEWVNVRRIRVKDSVEYIFWLSASAFPKADNSKVLQAYSKDMERLIKRGVKQTKRPSGHNIKPTFSARPWRLHPGEHHHLREQREQQQLHQAIEEAGAEGSSRAVPGRVARFFIEFLTEPGDLVLDPFAGSNTTGAVAEQLGRHWLAIEKDETYAKDSELRFKVSEPKRQSQRTDVAV